ncbi:hypothetical protein HPP92_010264 [Vanilla planifolia]|uniref:Uncharacterized protein n=1 Tax=Vanilla planifolia TaxID=51239 RepID=A0A835QYM7_VANPL|nr:hypothetical protein HPP92_010264 [Vanilla planifolia]
MLNQTRVFYISPPFQQVFPSRSQPTTTTSVNQTTGILSGHSSSTSPKFILQVSPSHLPNRYIPISMRWEGLPDWISELYPSFSISNSNTRQIERGDERYGQRKRRKRRNLL